MEQTTKSVRFVVNSADGYTGVSDTFSINGIINGFDIFYNELAEDTTDVYVYENNAGTIITVHEEANNNTDKYTAPSRDDPWVANGAYSVTAKGLGAGVPLTAAVTVIARVVIG